MAIIDQVISSGTSPFVANAICGQPTTLTAAGTTLAAGTLISTANAYFSIVSTSGKGGTLPQCSPGSSIFVYNGGSNTMNVYPPTALENIINGAAGAKFTLAANKGVQLNKLTSTQWGANLSA